MLENRFKVENEAGLFKFLNKWKKKFIILENYTDAF